MGSEGSQAVASEPRHRRLKNGGPFDNRVEVYMAEAETGEGSGGAPGGSAQLEPPAGVAPPRARWDPTVDPGRGRFPCCVCWSPIHPITWLYPFIGHMGVADSDGTTYDFAGGIHVGRMAFGPPTRYVQLDPAQALPKGGGGGGGEADGWDAVVGTAVSHYDGTQRYDFCTNNCHSFVAEVLNRMAYGGRDSWTMLHVGAWLVLLGSFTGVVGALASLGPPAVVIVGCTLLFGPGFLWFWLLSSLCIIALFATLVATGSAAPRAAKYARVADEPATNP